VYGLPHFKGKVNSVITPRLFESVLPGRRSVRFNWLWCVNCLLVYGLHHVSTAAAAAAANWRHSPGAAAYEPVQVGTSPAWVGPEQGCLLVTVIG
jgi:hypothetical protein